MMITAILTTLLLIVQVAHLVLFRVAFWWAAVQCWCIIASVCCLLYTAIINDKYAVFCFTVSAFSSSVYSLSVMAQLIHEAQHLDSTVWWSVLRSLVGLASGWSALRRSEEEEEREKFNRRFASKFFHADSAIIL